MTHLVKYYLLDTIKNINFYFEVELCLRHYEKDKETALNSFYNYWVLYDHIIAEQAKNLS